MSAPIIGQALRTSGKAVVDLTPGYPGQLYDWKTYSRAIVVPSGPVVAMLEKKMRDAERAMQLELNRMCWAPKPWYRRIFQWEKSSSASYWE